MNTAIPQSLTLLGLRVRDVVRGIEGVVTSISFDLSGCIQAYIAVAMEKDPEGKLSRWVDVKQLVCVGDLPVMARPHFAGLAYGQEIGSQSKGAPPSGPG